MRILFLSEAFPFPLHDGGNLRTYHLLRGLASRHEVCLLSHAPRNPSDTAALSDVCRVVHVPSRPKLRRIAANALRPRGWRQPFFLWKNRAQALLDAASRLLQTDGFEAIHFNHLDTACFAVERRWAQKQVFDSHNCLSAMTARMRTGESSRLQAAHLAREYAALRDLEAAVCRRMDVTLTCSIQDAESFRRLYSAVRTEVVPNGVDCDYFQPGDSAAEEEGALVFTGTMGYWPNEQAAMYFCREVLPILRASGKATRLYLVGRDPSPRVRALHDGHSVIVTGAVDDVRPYVHRAQAVVVPLHQGGGTRLKILEAFAMNKAVISTSLGAEGIPAQHDQEILLADDAASFARRTLDVLDDAALRNRLGRQSREFAVEQFDWRTIQRSLYDVYESLFDRAAYAASGQHHE